MSDSLNRLILASTMGETPVRAAWKGYDDATRSQMNRLSMESTALSMEGQQQQQRQRETQMQQQQQDRKISIAADYMLPVARANQKDRVSVFQRQKEALMRDHGIPSPDWDEASSMNQINTLLNRAGKPYYKTRKAGDQSLVRTEMLSGKEEKILTETDYSGRSSGNAEIERHMNWLRNYNVPFDATESQIDAMDNLTAMQRAEAKTRAQRVQTRAGIDQTLAQELRLNRQVGRDVVSDQKVIQDQYSGVIKPYAEARRNINAAIASMESGDSKLSNNFLAAALSQIQDTDTRAMGMFDVYQKNFGHLLERFYRNANEWITGEKTAGQKKEILDTLDYMKTAYIEPSLRHQRDYHRRLARQRKTDDQGGWFTVPPDGSEFDLELILSEAENGQISEQTAEQLINTFYPGRLK